jgi:hypothetical protein
MIQNLCAAIRWLTVNHRRRYARDHGCLPTRRNARRPLLGSTETLFFSRASAANYEISICESESLQSSMDCGYSGVGVPVGGSLPVSRSSAPPAATTLAPAAPEAVATTWRPRMATACMTWPAMCGSGPAMVSAGLLPAVSGGRRRGAKSAGAGHALRSRRAERTRESSPWRIVSVHQPVLRALRGGHARQRRAHHGDESSRFSLCEVSNLFFGLS